MLVLFLAMFGFVFTMTLTSWAATIFLTSVFPIFKFKDEFIEFWIRTRGSPPSRKQLLLNAQGVCNIWFRNEICDDLNVPNGIRIVPNANYFHFFMIQFVSLFIAVLFWIIMFLLYVVAAAYF